MSPMQKIMPAKIARMSKRRQKVAMRRWLSRKIADALRHFVGHPINDGTKAAMQHEVEHTVSIVLPAVVSTVFIRNGDQLRQAKENERGHNFDEDACCTHCGFDGAEWAHWKRYTHEGKAHPDAKPPLCTHLGRPRDVYPQRDEDPYDHDEQLIGDASDGCGEDPGGIDG